MAPQQKKQNPKPQKQKKKKSPPPSDVKKEVKKVEKKVKNLQKKTSGPKPDDRMVTTVTLGCIIGQSAQGLTRQMRLPLNPLLMKPNDAMETSTPLSIRASMYELWRPEFVVFRALPLVGHANLAGSIGLASLTLNGLEAGADSIDTVKAKRHIVMTLGKPKSLRLTARELSGPRDGWWLVDTSASAADAYGPAVDVFLAYPTQNLLSTTGTQTTHFTGALWQVEMLVKYSFSTYNPKPALAKLAQATFSGNEAVTITKSEEDGSLVMQVNEGSRELFRMLNSRDASGQTKGKGSTVWAVAGAAVDAVSPLLGPWGWLLKGGWFLIRKIFGASSANGVATFQIYPSINAAMEDQPIYNAPSSQQTVTFPLVHVSEVMSPNPENDEQSAVASTFSPPSYGLPLVASDQPNPYWGEGATRELSLKQGASWIVGNFVYKLYTNPTRDPDNGWWGVSNDSLQKPKGWVTELGQNAVLLQGWTETSMRQNMNGAMGTGHSFSVANLRRGLGDPWSNFSARPGSNLEMPSAAIRDLQIDTTQTILYKWARIYGPKIEGNEAKVHPRAFIVCYRKTNGSSGAAMTLLARSADPPTAELCQPLYVALSSDSSKDNGGYLDFALNGPNYLTTGLDPPDSDSEEDLDSDSDLEIVKTWVRKHRKTEKEAKL